MKYSKASTCFFQYPYMLELRYKYEILINNM